jgi:hypothetical protein
VRLRGPQESRLHVLPGACVCAVLARNRVCARAELAHSAAVQRCAFPTRHTVRYVCVCMLFAIMCVITLTAPLAPADGSPQPDAASDILAQVCVMCAPVRMLMCE